MRKPESPKKRRAYPPKHKRKLIEAAQKRWSSHTGLRTREIRAIRSLLKRQRILLNSFLPQSKDFEPKTASFENRLAEYESVFEKRKRRKTRFAGQKPKIAALPMARRHNYNAAP